MNEIPQSIPPQESSNINSGNNSPYRGEGVSNLQPDMSEKFEEALIKQLGVQSENQKEDQGEKEKQIEQYKDVIGEITSTIEKDWLQDDEV